MAKVKKRIEQRKTKTKLDYLKIDLQPINYYILGIGLLLIVIGYVFLAQNSVDGFLPTVAAPIFLVSGYCVVIPFGLLFKQKQKDEKIDFAVAAGSEPSAEKSNINVH